MSELGDLRNLVGKFAVRLDEDPADPAMRWLLQNGLIEWNGEYRNGRKVWVATEKSETHDGQLPRGGSSVER